MSSLPSLSPKKINDDIALADGVDRVIRNDRGSELHSMEIRWLQTALKGKASEDAWQTFLKLEEITNARWAELGLILVRWGISEGMRCAGKDR